MKHKLTTVLTLGLFGLTLAANAQITDAVLKKYPAHIIPAVQDINKLVNLSDQQQMQLAAYINSQDGLADERRLKGASSTEINSYYILKADKLAGILTPLQLHDYMYRDANNNTSEISKAISQHNKLILTESQLTELFKAEKAEKPGGISKEAQKAEFAVLKQILNSNQYRQYFINNNADKAAGITQDSWMLVKANGLAGKLDSAKECAATYAYEIKKTSQQDYLTYNGTDEDLDLFKKQIEAERPLLEIYADAIEQRAGTSALTNAFNLRDELHLSSEQKVKLADKLYQLRHQIAVNKAAPLPVKFDEKGWAAKASRSILTKAQREQVYKLVNKQQALAFSNTTWLQLKSQDLAQLKDSAALTRQIYNFKLNQLISLDSVADVSPKQTDSVKKISNVYKPVILWKLDAFTGALPGTSLTKVIDQRKALQLTDTQIDSLIAKIIAIEKIKTAMTIKYKDAFISQDKLRKQAILSILTDLQYVKYLSVVDMDLAHFNADKDWDSLVGAKLITKETDTEKLKRDLLNYELQLLQVSERYNTTKSPRDKEAKSYIESTIPPILKKFNDANNLNATNKRLKEAFAW